MNISDRIVATIKTGVPTAWGLALAWLIAQFPVVQDALTFIDTNLAQVTLGVPVSKLIELALLAGVVAGYYWLAAKVGDRFPAVRKWLLGSSLVPVYDPQVVTDPNTGDVSILTRAEYQAYLQSVVDDAGSHR